MNNVVNPATEEVTGRELGMHGLDGYSEIKNVYLSTD